MKKLLLVLNSILILWMSTLALAQSTSVNIQNPNAHALHKRIRQQLKQIVVDLKAGKITEAQAKIERQNLMAIHQQEVQLKNQNGSHELTDSQAKQLNAKLDSNSTQN